MIQRALPRLRTDLEIVPKMADGGILRYLVKVHESEETYEFGEEEFFLCRQMDGRTSFPRIREAFEVRYGKTLPPHQLEAFARRLDSAGLLVSGQEGVALDRPLDLPGRSISWLNLDRTLGLLAGVFGWCFSLPFLIFGSVLAFFAIGIVLADAGDYLYEVALLKRLVGPSIFWLVPLLGYFLISVVSEIAKGVACRHFGGQVSGLRVFSVYKILPRFYFDIYDSLWFMTRWQRVRVLLSGPVSQLLLWSVGVIGWKHATPGSDLHVFWTLFTLSAFIFLILNINPLLQRDGYLLLTVWNEKWDLRARAEAVARAWLFRSPPPEPLSSKELRFFRWYGLLSRGFRYVLEISILGVLGYFLIENMKGAGAVSFLIVLYLRFEDFMGRMLRRVAYPRRWVMNQSGAVRFAWIWKLVLLLGFAALMFVPYPYEAGGDFKILPMNECGIRAKVPGEIEKVFVQEGEWIKAGQALAKLTGREQRKRVEELEATIEKSQANLQLLKKGAKPEEIAKARQEIKAAATSYAYSKSQAERAEKMFREKAIPEKDYENALRVRDLDMERLESAKKNLELVESGFRDEQVRAIEAEIRAYEVQLRHAEENLELISLVSPIEGRVITPGLPEKVGQYINTGDLFAVVEDVRNLIAEIALPEEEVGEIKDGARVKLRAWAYPTTVFEGRVRQIAPVAFEQSRGRIERAYSEREWLIEQSQTIRERGRVVRVLCEVANTEKLLKTDMTGYAKIESSWRPVGVAFTQWFIRFLFVEVWSWIP